ncbi:MAG: hypothetical protein ABSF34_02190 [Verrucomicrobiota bacterium]
MIGRSIRELLRPDPQGFENTVNELQRAAEWTGELQKTTKSRGVITVDCRWILLPNHQGNPPPILVHRNRHHRKGKKEARFRRTQRMT